MIVTVIKDSVIYNGIIYRKDESFEAEDAIGKSLAERGYVSITAAAPADEASEVDAEETAAEAQEAVVEACDLESMSYSELKRIASQKGLSAVGKKNELIARIIAAEQETEDEVEAEADELPNTNMPD